ncbi:DUF7017 domain-containing protein [Aliivibrio fischeri]|uniref:Tetratricopeptide repeat protein n=1 Tax=Aliivibrio fischeri TaxID=668 RepID=A0A844P4B5_ALIFS|nr:tetratricopeptide repeat protein [Aliivibrio fischeri]MUK50037.1 tetratricopeptide repeat protein [Aliivibrio fischeri]MUK64469.1 tetratricopeptide repeat protein [Aliivibrio fischeri]
MISSKEVFALRRAGKVDDAYQMAVQLVANNAFDEWNVKALAWCLIDLIKRDATRLSQHQLDQYTRQLTEIRITNPEESLVRQTEYVISLCNPNGKLIAQAKAFSQSGEHLESADIYRKLMSSGAIDGSICTSLGWEIYRLLNQALSFEHVNVFNAKKLLFEYLKLPAIDKPSLLHSQMLRLAAKLAGDSSFDLSMFVRYWQLNYLQDDDFLPYITDNGEQYPSLAEKVIQQASKEAALKDNEENILYILPFLDEAIDRCAENVWLKLNKAKLLMKLDRGEGALKFALEVARNKVNDYWAWELLGDVNALINSDTALSCYCKALLCRADDKFTSKVRLKVVEHLLNQGEFSAAKHEIENVIRTKIAEGASIPEQVNMMTSSEWFRSFEAESSNKSFYRDNVVAAEDLLFSQIAFVDACVGEIYTLPDRPNKPKRKLYVKIPDRSEPLEIAVPNNKHHFGLVGSGLSVKGDFDVSGKFQVYLIVNRATQQNWDIFSERVAVVDHVNPKKGVFHYVASRSIHGVAQLSDFGITLQEGDPVAIKVVQYNVKGIARTRVLSIASTDMSPAQSAYKTFSSDVRESNGMGFTEDNIFISPPLMSKYLIEDGDYVSGKAVLSLNKKRGDWGWKALFIDTVDKVDI